MKKIVSEVVNREIKVTCNICNTVFITDEYYSSEKFHDKLAKCPKCKKETRIDLKSWMVMDKFEYREYITDEISKLLGYIRNKENKKEGSKKSFIPEFIVVGLFISFLIYVSIGIYATFIN